MKISLLGCVVVALLGSACGKDKEGSGGGGGAAGGPTCAEAAAAYTKAQAEGFGNRLAKLKPTPEQLTAITAKVEAGCTSANWPAETKACIVATTDGMASSKCLKRQAVETSQIVFDAVKEIEAAAPAAPAAGSGDGSAAAGSGDGSAAN